MPELLSVDDLHVWIDARDGRKLHVVRGLSISLQEGERVAVVGESGCGKTTLLLALLRLLPEGTSISGAVRLGALDLLRASSSELRRHRWTDIAVVFQGAMNALNPVQSIGDQIAEAITVHERSHGEDRKRLVGELLEMVGLPSDRSKRYPHELSGGMRQRACIAMALACRPRLILADEPTTALDVIVQRQILELIRTLSEELKIALILVTHDLPIVRLVCERVLVMYAGRIIEEAPTQSFFRRPKHPYTEALLNAVPSLAGTGTVKSIPGRPPRLDQDFPGCSFAPRCIRHFDPCTQAVPALVPIEPGHRAACFLHTDAAA